MWIGIAAVSCAAFMYLLILGSSDPEQRALDDAEQLEYLRQYWEKKKGQKP